MRLEEGFLRRQRTIIMILMKNIKPSERIAEYNALPQALGAIPSLEHYIARANSMGEAEAQRAADIKDRYHNYLDKY